MRTNFWMASFTTAAIFISGTSHAALVNLSFTGLTDAGGSMESIFTIDTDDMLAAQLASGGGIGAPGGPGPVNINRLPLTASQFISGTGTTTIDSSTGYYGDDANGETTEFRVSDNNSSLQMTTIFDSMFTYDDTNGDVTYSGMFRDPLIGFTSFAFSGTNFTVDLTTISESGFNGSFNSNNFTVDTLNVSIDGVSPVPVPAAVWLFGSGLLGLAGIARRRSI